MTAPMSFANDPATEKRIRDNIALLVKRGMDAGQAARMVAEYEGLIPSRQPSDQRPTSVPGVPDPTGLKGIARQFQQDPLGTAAGYGAAALHGATLGASDFIPGNREFLAQFREQNPVSTGLTELVGGLVNPLGKGLKAAESVAKAANLPRVAKAVGSVAEAAAPTQQSTTKTQAFKQGVKGGALYSGIYGFNTGEGGVSDRLANAVASVPFGGTLGGAMGVTLQQVARKIRPLQKGQPHPDALTYIEEAFAADKGSIPNPMQFLAGDVVADQGGANVAALLQEALRASPNAISKGQSFAKARQQDVHLAIGDIAEDVAGLNLGGARANPLSIARVLAQKAQQRAAPLYAALQKENRPIELTPTLRVVLSDPTVRGLATGRDASVFAETRRNADLVRSLMGKGERGDVGTPPTFIDKGIFGGKVLDSNTLPNWKQLDLLKQRLDNMLSSEKGRGLGKAERADLRALRSGLVAELDAQVPGYKAARDAFAGPLTQKEMLERGMKSARKGADFVEADLSDPNILQHGADAVAHYRLAVLAELKNQAGRRPVSAGPEAFWTPNRQRVLQAIASDPHQAQAVPRLVEIQNRRAETAALVPARTTGSVASPAESLRGTLMGGGAALFSGHPAMAARIGAGYLASRGRKMTPRMADDIVSILLHDDPAAALAWFQQQAGGSVGGKAGELAGRIVGTYRSP